MKVLLIMVAALSPGSPARAQVDPLVEVGDNDLRISFQLGSGDPSFAARFPAVAYNATNREYLVVWEGEYVRPFPSLCPPDSPTEQEIFRQRIDAATGELIASAGRISSSGPNCDNTHQAFWPAVVWNAEENEYLVVWHGDDDDGGLSDNELEIFGQRLDSIGNPTGLDDFRISDAGGTGPHAWDAEFPAVTWSPVENEYLVVWEARDEVALGAEYQIFGQRLNENGTPQGENDFQISHMAYYAFHPAVTWNGTENEYLVVWEGWDDEGGLLLGESEIFGQRLDASGSVIGDDDLRISDMGGTGDPLYGGFHPRVTWNATANEYLVVWGGTDNVGGMSAMESEIFGQRLDSSGGAIGNNDFRVSDMGGTGENPFDGSEPDVTWNGAANEYLVVWHGDDDVEGLIDGEWEIFGQRLDSSGGDIGDNDFRISNMGGTGDSKYGGIVAAVTWNELANEYLVLWQGDDDEGLLVEGEIEIFGQRLALAIFVDGFESGDPTAWASSVP